MCLFVRTALPELVLGFILGVVVRAAPKDTDRRRR